MRLFFVRPLRAAHASLRAKLYKALGPAPAAAYTIARLGWALLGAAVVLAAGLVLAHQAAWRMAQAQQRQALGGAALRLAETIERPFLEVQPVLERATAWLAQPCAQAQADLHEQVTRLPELGRLDLIEQGRVYCSSDPRFATEASPLAITPGRAADGSAVIAARLPGHFAGRPLWVVRGRQVQARQVVALLDSGYADTLLRAGAERSYDAVSARIGGLAFGSTAGVAGTATVPAAPALAATSAMPGGHAVSDWAPPAVTQLSRPGRPGVPALLLTLHAAPRYAALLAQAHFPRFAALAALLALLAGALIYRCGHPDWRALRRLRRALVRRDFVPYYQPVVDARRGRCVGVEVLARWRLEDGQVLGPAAFIDLAERSALVLALTRQLMERVANDLRSGALPRGLRIAVNLSSLHLRDHTIVAELRSIFAELLAQYRFDVEVTERAVINDSVQAAQVLEQIRALGVEIAVDDFGTDYSSLKYLQQFRFDLLKIDRSFVMGLPDDPTSLAIVSALCALSSKLGMQVVAEGVETAAQARCLLGHGVHLLQGFYYGPALSFNALLVWLNAPAVPIESAGPR
jgi:sensor c-di-GMP phosphodiesterase-like protein